MAYLMRRGGSWYIRWTDPAGKDKKKSVGKVTKEKALAVFADWKRARDLGAESTDTSVWAFTERLKAYLAMHRRPHTAKSYLYEWERFLERNEDVYRLSHITPAIMEAYRDRLLTAGGATGKPLAPGTVRAVLLKLCAVLAIAINDLRVFAGPNPVQGRMLPKAPKSKPKYLPAESAAKLLATAQEWADKGDPNMLLVCALGFLAGLRKDEIANCKVRWFVRKPNRWLLVVQDEPGFRPKGADGEDEPIPVSDALRKIIETYVPLDDPGRYIIYPDIGPKDDPIAYRVEYVGRFKTLCKVAGVSCTIHQMRHTFGSLHAIEGKSLFKIQKWMRHKNPQTTMIYAHLSDDDDEINYSSL